MTGRRWPARCDGVPFYIEQVVAGLSRDRGARGAV